MQVKCFVAIAASFFLSVTGCHLGGVGANDFGPGGGNLLGAACTCGSCSGLVGRLRGAGCSACGDSSCAGGCVSPNTLTRDGFETGGGYVGPLARAGFGTGGGYVGPLAPAGFGTGGGYVGPLARFIGGNHRGAQSHMGAYPGPAAGPPTGTATYQYYTTRGPRDFFLDDPPSIGR